MDHPRLQELIDHHDIRQLLATYCHGCDRMDEVEMASTYAADSWDDHGPRKMPGKPFSIATVGEALETTTVVSHLLGQSLIKVDGDSAGAETYFIATLMYPPRDGVETLNQLGGRYVDTLVREGGQWLIEQPDHACANGRFRSRLPATGWGRRDLPRRGAGRRMSPMRRWAWPIRAIRGCQKYDSYAETCTDPDP